MERKICSLATLCLFILTFSACSMQAVLPPAQPLPAGVSDTLSPSATDTPHPADTPLLTAASTDTPVPPTATMDLPQIQMATEKGATAWAQTLVADLPQTATVIAQLNQTAHPAMVIPETWAFVRSVLPSDILVYMPTDVPARFGSPEVYEVNVQEPLFGGPVYTIGYWKRTEDGDPNTVVFILNNGQGSWGAEWTGPGFTTKSITIDGVSGELYMIPGENSSPSLKGETFYRASCKKQGQYYQVKAISSKMTEAEFMQIVHSLVQLKK